MPAPSEKGGRAVLWGLLLVAAAVIGFVLGGHFYPRENTAEPSSCAASGPSTKLDKVVARGRIKPRDGLLPIGVLAPDRIRRVLVKEGDIVKKDALLAVLDSERMRQRELELARIQLNQAKERLSAIQKNGKAQIHVEKVRLKRIEELGPFERNALQSKIEFLKAQEKNAQKDYERYVAAGDTIAKQDLEKQKLALQQVQAELEDTKSQLEKLEKSSALNRRVASAQLEAAQAESEQSQSVISLDLLDTQVKQAEERLKETKIRAPSDGKILHLFVCEGERVGDKPILEMANVNHMIVLAEVYESDIEHVKPGQEATVTSDIGHIFQKDKDPLKGKVLEIAGIVGKARVVPLDPLAAADKRVVEVKIDLVELASDQAKAKQVANLIDHQVLVEIDTGPAEGPP